MIVAGRELRQVVREFSWHRGLTELYHQSSGRLTRVTALFGFIIGLVARAVLPGADHPRNRRWLAGMYKEGHPVIGLTGTLPSHF